MLKSFFDATALHSNVSQIATQSEGKIALKGDDYRRPPSYAEKSLCYLKFLSNNIIHDLLIGSDRIRHPSMRARLTILTI